MFHYKLPRSPWFYWLIAAFLIIEVFAGCSTPKKIEKKTNYLVAHGYNVTLESSVDSLCAVRFPIKDSLIKGDDVVSIDTVYAVYIDTVQNHDTVTRNCPKALVITRTVHTTDTIFKTNTAQLSVAQKQLEQARKNLGDTVTKYEKKVTDLQAEISKLEKEKAAWRKWFFYALTLIGLAVGWQLLKARLKLPF